MIAFVLVVPMFSVFIPKVKAFSNPYFVEVGISYEETSTPITPPITQTPEGHMRLWYHVYNPNSYSVDVILGASIQIGASYYDDPPHDKVVTLYPGHNNPNRYFYVPYGVPTGSYTVIYAIWATDWSEQYDIESRPGWVNMVSSVSVQLSSSPSNVGTITWDSVTYSLLGTVHTTTRIHWSGVDDIHCTPPAGYEFDHWEASGDVDPWDEYSQWTSVSVDGSGSLQAVFRVTNHAPILSDGYVEGEGPWWGYPDTEFKFLVKYKDQDGDPPDRKHVYIYDSEEGWQRFSMSHVVGNPVDGEWFMYIRSGFLVEQHKCFFHFTDGQGGEDFDPDDGYHYFDVVEKPPNTISLSSRTTDGLNNLGSITFDSQTYDLSATFSKSDGTYKATANPPNGYDFDSWEHSGSISVTNSMSQTTDVTVSGDGSLKAVFSGINDPPVLSNGYVDPTTGDTSTLFYYYVDYYDADGDAPTQREICIDESSWHQMMLVSGVASDGTYRYQSTQPEGDHNYFFKFSDGVNPPVQLPSSGTYSGPTVTPEVTITYFSPIERSYDAGERAEFQVWLYNPTTSTKTYWVQIKIAGLSPTEDSYLDYLALPASSITIEAETIAYHEVDWDIPSSTHPRTAIPAVIVYDANPDVTSGARQLEDEFGALFMIEDPDVSYIEVSGTENHRVIHIHIQRFALTDLGQPMSYYEWVTMWKATRAALFDVFAFYELLTRLTTEYERTVNLASSTPYDLTILQLYGEVGYVFEESPAELLDNALLEGAAKICWAMVKEALKIQVGIGPIPPIENLVPIPEEYLGYQVPYYAYLDLPIVVDCVKLSPTDNPYGRDGIVGIRVKIAEPQTGAAVTGTNVWVGIAAPPYETTTTPTVSLLEVSEGEYSGNVDIQLLFGGGPLEGVPIGSYIMTAYTVKPASEAEKGFLGISPIGVFNVDATYDGMEVYNLEISASPQVIDSDDSSSVDVGFNWILPQMAQASITIEIKENMGFFGLIDKSLGTYSTTEFEQFQWISHTFSVPASSLGYLTHIGTHQIYAIATLSWIPPETTFPITISRRSYEATITVIAATASMRIEAHSPVNILVTDPLGRQIGFDYISGEIINEIQGATYSGPETDPQVITIPNPIEGTYVIDAYGTDTGQFTITMSTVAQDGTLIETVTWTDTAEPEQQYTQNVQLESDLSIEIVGKHTLLVNVVDSYSGDPIPSADANVEGPEIVSGTTDGGSVEFILEAGEYIVTASAYTYYPASTTVVLTEDTTITLELTKSVGGIEVPINTFALFAPWILLILAMFGAIVAVKRKRKH